MKKILAILLSCAQLSWGAIAYDATANGADTGGEEFTISWSHTMGAGANNAMAVCVTAYLVPLVNPTVTFDGQSLGLIQSTSIGGGYYSFLFYGVGFPSGSHTVTVNETAGTSYLTGGSASFTGVSQTGTPDNSATHTGTSTSMTVSITPVAANAYGVDCVGTGSDGSTMTPEAWTEVQNYNGISAFSYGMAYTGPISALSTDTWGASPFVSYGFEALTMAPPAIASTPVGGTLPMMGVMNKKF